MRRIFFLRNPDHLLTLCWPLSLSLVLGIQWILFIHLPINILFIPSSSKSEQALKHNITNHILMFQGSHCCHCFPGAQFCFQAPPLCHLLNPCELLIFVNFFQEYSFMRFYDQCPWLWDISQINWWPGRIALNWFDYEILFKENLVLKLFDILMKILEDV